MTSTPDGRIRQLDTYDYSNTFDDNSWEQVSFRYDANDWRTLKFSGNKGSYTLGISQERKVPMWISPFTAIRVSCYFRRTLMAVASLEQRISIWATRQ